MTAPDPANPENVTDPSSLPPERPTTKAAVVVLFELEAGTTPALVKGELMFVLAGAQLRGVRSAEVQQASDGGDTIVTDLGSLLADRTVTADQAAAITVAVTAATR